MTAPYGEETFVELRDGDKVVYRMITGHIEVQRATGMTTETYPDGSIHEYEIGTPTRWYNGRGEIVREEPFEAFTHLVHPAPKQSWWKFW